MKNLVTYLLIVLLVPLTACVSPPVKPTIATSFEPGKGFAVVRVVTNAGTVDRGSFVQANQWTAIQIADKDGKVHELQPHGQGGESNSQVFVAQLPQGIYKFHAMYARLVGTVTISLQALDETFEIKSSQLTALGTIIVQPTGNREFAALRDNDNSSLQRLYAKLFPELANLSRESEVMQSRTGGAPSSGKLSKGGVIVTSNSATTGIVGTLTLAVVQSLVDSASTTDIVQAWQNEKDPAKRLNMARDSTYILNDAVLLPSGELFAGSDLGQVLVRKSDGKWGRIDTGDVREITAVLAESSQHILVGGEEGLVAETNDSGHSWVHLKSLPANSVVLDLQRFGADLFALVLENDDAVFYRRDETAGTGWSELKREKNARIYPSWHAAGGASGARVNDRYVIVTASGNALTYDFSKQQWSSQKTPFSPGYPIRSYTLRTNGSGAVYALGGRTTYLTMDDGKTWHEKTNSCMRLLDAWLTADNTTYNLCTEGAFVVSTTFSTKPANRDHWNELGTTPVLAGGWFVSDDGKLIVLAGTEGILYSSKDHGKSWARERTPFN